MQELQTLDISKTEDAWTNVKVDSQVLSLFMTCPRKYQYVFERLFAPLKEDDGIVRGSIFHAALFRYWKERIETGNIDMAIQSGIRIAKEKFDSDSRFDREARLSNLNVLLEFFKYIQSKNWIPLAAENYFKVKILEDERLKLRIFITGSIDLVARLPNSNSLYPIDFKSESKKRFYSEMSNQFRMYAIACETNMMGVQRIGLQDNVETEEKFKTETLVFDPDVLDEFKNITLPHYVKQMLIMHEDGYFPMNTVNCVQGYFKCMFADGNDHKGICNVSRSVREQKLARYFKIGEKWDPAKLGSE